MNYSELIIAIRANLNLTQQELAEKLNVNYATVNRWENGKRAPSKRYIFLLNKICKENNIWIDEGIFDGKN